MCIIGGKWCGMKLFVLLLLGLWLSSDWVCEMLFNWLMLWLGGVWVLDLFVGSGVLGLEVVLCGVVYVILVEKDGGLFW